MTNIEKWINERIPQAQTIKELNSIWRVWVLFTDKSQDYIFDDVVRKYGKENLQTNNMR